LKPCSTAVTNYLVPTSWQIFWPKILLSLILEGTGKNLQPCGLTALDQACVAKWDLNISSKLRVCEL
jgi:hypothetical protein